MRVSSSVFFRQTALAGGLTALMGMLVSTSALAAPDAMGSNDGRIRTQLISKDQVVISSELSAKISSLPLREGNAFHRGELLVGFDCDTYQAELQKAKATVDASQHLLDVDTRLAALHSVGQLDVDQAAAKLKEDQAEVAVMSSTVQKCQIRAPFNGRVAERKVANYQYVTPGTPLLEVVDTGDLELQMIVPSKWLSWLKTGTSFTVQIDELGKSFPARVTRIGASINAVSQSVTLSATITGNRGSLLPGMSGWASFTPGSK